MAGGSGWKAGWDDAVPMAILAVPLLAAASLAGSRALAVILLVVAALLAGLVLKRILPENQVDWALLPPGAALLSETSALPLTVNDIVLAAAAGVGLLLWAGTAPSSGVPLPQRLEPAVMPALAVSVAIGVMQFLPSGSGQVGVAVVVLVAVLGLAAWLTSRSAAEAALPRPTS